MFLWDAKGSPLLGWTLQERWARLHAAWHSRWRTGGKRPARRPSSARQAVRARWSRIVHHPPSSLQGKFTGDLDDSRAVCPVSRYHDRIGPQFLSTLLEKFCQQGESNTFGGSRARIVRSIFTRPRFRRARSGCVICFPSKDPASWHHRTAA